MPLCTDREGTTHCCFQVPFQSSPEKKDKNKDIIIIWCPCHIHHNASGKARTAFSEVTGFKIQDHCIDVFYWFDKSSEWKSILKEYYEFCDSEYQEIIKFISMW